MDEIALLRQARSAIQDGHREQGQRLLRQVIQQNPRSEVAWLWLSAIVDDPAKEARCLEKVLDINPGNEVARQHWLRVQSVISVPDRREPIVSGAVGLPTNYAGFWKRFAAMMIDSMVWGILSIVLGVCLFLVLLPQGRMDESVRVALNCLSFLLGLTLGWLYNAVMESSHTQGTLGKMAVGIKVTDLQGNPISLERATGRYFAKYLSNILYIGFIMTAWTEKKQALHDILSGCLVLNKE